MLLDYRDKVDKWKGRLRQAWKKWEACSGGDPLNRLRIKESGSGHEPDESSMCHRNKELENGTWRRVMGEMLIDGNIPVLEGCYGKEYCREVTGAKINKHGRWWEEVISSEIGVES